MKRIAALFSAFLVLFAAVTPAQTQPLPPINSTAGVFGLDSGTGLRCIIGTTSTCQLPTTAAPAGSTSNATTLANSSNNNSTVSYLFAQNGTTWYPLTEYTFSGANALAIDAVTGGGLLAAINGPPGCANTTAAPSYTTGTTNPISCDTAGNERVVVPGGVSPAASATGGATPYHAQSAASNNATLVSTGAHTLYTLTVMNTTASLACLHIYDNASSPTVGTTPIKHTYTAGAVASAGVGAGGVAITYPVGELYANGLAWSLTGGASSTCTDIDTSSGPLGVSVEMSY